MRNSYTENIAREIPIGIARGFAITGVCTSLAVMTDDALGTGVGYKILEIVISENTATQLREVEPCPEKYAAVVAGVGMFYGVYVGFVAGVISGIQTKRQRDKEYFDHFRR